MCQMGGLKERERERERGGGGGACNKPLFFFQTHAEKRTNLITKDEATIIDIGRPFPSPASNWVIKKKEGHGPSFDKNKPSG